MRSMVEGGVLKRNHCGGGYPPPPPLRGGPPPRAGEELQSAHATLSDPAIGSTRTRRPLDVSIR